MSTHPAARSLLAVFQGLLVESWDYRVGASGYRRDPFRVSLPGNVWAGVKCAGAPRGRRAACEGVGHPLSRSSARALPEASCADSTAASAFQPLWLKRCLFSTATAIIQLQQELCKPGWRAALLK